MKRLGNASLAATLLATLLAALSAVGCADDPAPAEHPVVVRVDVATSAECPDSGSVVRSGVDLDDDGELADGEVLESSVLCDDAPAPALVRVEDEPAGENCAEGGSAVHSGLDDDGDGVLADTEIDETDYLCNGEPLTPTPTPALARIEDEPAGGNCAEGGSAVHSGLDDDGDGVLADTEIDATTYLCGAPTPTPTPTLVRIDDEPAGTHCAEGGSAVHSGLDDDGDGVLADDEIDATMYLCDAATPTPTPQEEPETTITLRPPALTNQASRFELHSSIAGSTFLCSLDDGSEAPCASPFEPALADGLHTLAVAAVSPQGARDRTPATATWTIDTGAPALSELAIEPAGAHCVAGGSVLHTGHDDDGDAQLDAEEIEHSEYRCGGVLVGDYNIDSQQAADALAGIQVVTGNLIVDPTQGLSSHYDIVLPDLRIVGGNVVSDEPLYLDSFAAPELVRISGRLQVNSRRVQSLTLPKLAVVTGDVIVESLVMDGIALPALERVDGMVNTTTGGTVVDLTSLRTVGRDLLIHSHTEHLVMPALVSVGGLDLSTPNLVELRAPELRRVERRMRLGGNELTTLDLSRLTVVGEDLQVADTPIDTLSLPGLEVVGGKLLVFFLPATAIDLPRLKTVGKLVLRYLAITTLNLPELEEAGEIEILRNHELVSIAAAKLRTVGTFYMSHMPKLVDLTGLAGLEEVEDIMTIANCTALVDFTAFEKLEAVGVLAFGGNDALVSLGLPALRTVYDYLAIGLQPVGNLALERVDLPALEFANAMIIQGNHGLTQLQMPRLSQVTSVLRVHYNAALPACLVDAFHASMVHKPAEYDPYRNDGICPL